MSLSAASCSSSLPEEEPILEQDEDLGDVTDEEDWASIGAAALRAGSLPSRVGSGGGRIYSGGSVKTSRSRKSGGGGAAAGGGSYGRVVKRDKEPVTRGLVASVPVGGVGLGRYLGSGGAAIGGEPLHRQQHGYDVGGVDVVMEGMESNSQEREAIEALVRLSEV